jgi:hypothetical protein
VVAGPARLDTRRQVLVLDGTVSGTVDIDLAE